MDLRHAFKDPCILQFGWSHDIEVEDQVSAYMEYPNGATGVFITSTGEAPGTNRLEIAGDRGKLIYENGKISFTRNEVLASEFLRTSPLSFAKPPDLECGDTIWRRTRWSQSNHPKLC